MENRSFGELIKSLRGNITLKELSKKADITYVELSNIEQGKNMPRPTTIRKLASALNQDYTFLYNASQNKRKGE